MIANPVCRSRRALLLSAYDARSHRQWHETLTGLFPDIEWTRLTLPPRHFRWRVRGNSLSWAWQYGERLREEHDFLLTTSMTDLAALRGFVPELARLPTAVYFHENQFAYPVSERQSSSAGPQILNLYTALCADRLIFNSEYNRDTFFDGVEAFLRRMPDAVPPDLMRKLPPARVIPVPLPDTLFRREAGDQRSAGDDAVLTVAWNHRWEYDKGPGLLLDLTRELIRRDFPFRLHVVGQQFRRRPPELDRLRERLEEHYHRHGLEPGEFGHIDSREDYLSLLAGSHVVLSTALHDFQGLSMLEAMALGCAPLAPRKLVYPEYLPPECLFAGDDDREKQACSAAERLWDWAGRLERGEPLPDADVREFSARALEPRYRSLFDELCTMGTDAGRR